MTNGSNNFGVAFHQIVWIERLLRQHPNVVVVERTRDIVFNIDRKRLPAIQLVCLNEYTCGIARVLEVLDTFPGTNLIYVGGVWNGYTSEAKEYRLDAHIGLYNTGEMNGALYQNDFWAYHKKDKDGNPIYPFTF
jgi:hypothetical protein